MTGIGCGGGDWWCGLKLGKVLVVVSDGGDGGGGE